jgi:hypothetical protein
MRKVVTKGIAREELAWRLSQRTEKPYSQEQSCLPKPETAQKSTVQAEPAAPLSLGQVRGLSNSPYDYWDACFDSKVDFLKEWEWENNRFEIEYKKELEKRNAR